jgi:hypothetical protein
MNHKPLLLPITNEFEEKVQSILFQHEWLLSEIVEELQVHNPKFNPLGLHIMEMGLDWKQAGRLQNALMLSAEKAKNIEELHQLVQIWLDNNLPGWQESAVDIKGLVDYAKTQDEKLTEELTATDPDWQSKTLEQIIEEGKGES